MQIVKVYEIQPVFGTKAPAYVTTHPQANFTPREYYLPHGYKQANSDVIDGSGKRCVLHRDRPTGHLYLIDSAGRERLLTPVDIAPNQPYLVNWEALQNPGGLYTQF